jgi:hypothetical protein
MKLIAVICFGQGDTIGSVRSRLQERLGLPDKEWDKYRIATVIQGKAHYVEDEEDKTINIKVNQ